LIDAIEAMLSENVPDDAPGCAVAVVGDGQIQAISARGLANLEHAVPINLDTVFHVASVSKQFTAYACALLAERGALDLDYPVARILDRFPFDAITVRDLIHHVSGLRELVWLCLLAGRHLEDVTTADEIYRLVSQQRELDFEPRSCFAYCNTGFTLLASVVERISGLTLREFAAEEIFQPIRMVATRFVENHHEVVPHRADSYDSSFGGPYRRIALSYSSCGDSGVNTTVADLARWTLHAMSPPARQLLEQRITLSDGTLLSYGFGVMLGTRRQQLVVEHGGVQAGFRAHVAMFPEYGVAGMALSNNGSCPVYGLAHGLADLMLDRLNAPIDEPSVSRTSPGELADLGGLYLDVSSRKTYILVTEGDRVKLGGMEFEPVGPGVFGTTGVELQVRPDVRLRRIGLSEHQLIPADHWIPTPPELETFAGDYWSDELAVRWSITRRYDHLALGHPRWGELRLTPTIENGFSTNIPSTLMDSSIDLHFDIDKKTIRVTAGTVVRLEFRRMSFAREDSEPSADRSAPKSPDAADRVGLRPLRQAADQPPGGS
jgi:CubicO group peptidase (beta-lactamase class C family)